MTIAVIGAGAAGMMATATLQALAPTSQIILLEKNALMGRKVQISGGGRCNVTTGCHDVKSLLMRYQRGRKFLSTAMYHFPPDQVYDWFEDHGVPLKTEADGRVFPQSDVGKDVVDLFERLFQPPTVQLRLRTSVAAIKKTDRFHITLQSGDTILADKLILTTGGQAYRHTGSTGEGYQFAEAFGHHITPLAASLNSFIVSNQWVKQLAGVSFVAVGLSVPGHNTYQCTGPIVCTHQGISGPAVFALSSQVAFENYTAHQPLSVCIDFIPTMSNEQLRHELNTAITRNPKQQLRTTLHAWLPKSVVNALVAELGLPAEKTNAEVSNLMRQRVLDQLKRCPLAVIGRAAGDEFVTAGGIELSEVDPRTMESKLCPGLYFAGEILNIDGYTGGYNLQAAWATGHLAGNALANRLDN